jgi:two-component system sensor histidine kinase HydH
LARFVIGKRTVVSSRPYRWFGFIAGLVLALADFGALWMFEDKLALSLESRTRAWFGLFVVTYSVLGYVVGRLVETRGQARDDARLIGQQLIALEASHAQVVEFETLASIGRLAAGVAHEVRNPLGVIRSAAGLLLERLPSADLDARKAGVFICEEVDRLDDFVRALLDFSKPCGLTRRQVTLTALLERVQLIASSVLQETGVQLQFEVDPEETQELDLELLAGVLAGLVINAAEAIAEDDERAADGGRVGLRARRVDERTIIVEVADDGPGIATEVARTLFEPFVTTRARGTGLGLPMAARIVKAHGGTLVVRERAGLGPRGRGACFVATLPRAASATLMARGPGLVEDVDRGRRGASAGEGPRA